MITLENIPVQLKINSSGSINTGRYFSQNDNGVGNLIFTVYREDSSEIDYSQVSEAYITLKFQDGTYMEPCGCVIGENSITYELCINSLSVSGAVTGILKLYSGDSQVFTTNIFRFVVLADMVDGCTLEDEDKVSLINDLISKLANISFEEDTRDTDELLRKGNELTRVENESNRVSNEAIRVSNEAIRVNSETDRGSSEALRVTTFDTMESDYELLTNEIRDSLNRMVMFNVSELVSIETEELDRILFAVPEGYTFTITEITMISNGDAENIDAIKTSRLQLTEGLDIISDTIFNDTNLFPSNNIVKKLSIIDGLIDKDDNVYINILNDGDVKTPDFSLQINYDIVKIL